MKTFKVLLIVGVAISVIVAGALYANKYHAEKLEREKIDAEMAAIEKDLAADKLKWSYDKDKNEMGDVMQYAIVQSPNRVLFKFPYKEEGGSTFSLVIRKKNGSDDVYFTASKGNIVVADGARVKFDDEKPFVVDLDYSSTGNTDLVFITPTKKLISKLKASKKMIVEIPFFGQGNVPVTFNVSGLSWK